MIRLYDDDNGFGGEDGHEGTVQNYDLDIKNTQKEFKNNFGTGMQDPGDMAHSVR